MKSAACTWRYLSISLLAGILSLGAFDLGTVRLSQAEQQARLRARPECLLWLSFAELPDGMVFEPAPEQDVLEEVPGCFEGQQAVHIFHGRLKGKRFDIPPSGFTLSCWLKINALEPVDRQGYQRTTGGIMASGSGYYDGWRLLARPHNAGLTFSLGQPEGSRNLDSTGFLTTGKWHHVAITWEGRNLVMWIDGVARAETTAEWSYVPGDRLPYFRIGECSEGTGVLDFAIADLGFFSKALPGELFEDLGNPNAVLQRKLAAFLENAAPPPHPGLFLGSREKHYRQALTPLLELRGFENLPAVRQAQAYATLLTAQSLQRSGLPDEAESLYEELADDDTAMLVHRARAMLALGQMVQDRKNYTAARCRYEKTRDFFVARHEAFRTEAMARLRDIGTLVDGEPFRDERQRRIDRIAAAVPWFYVSPQGSDDNPGTSEAPFKSLERARDALRERRTREPLPRGGVAIVLDGGIYPRCEESFVLEACDSGTPEAPVVYCAAAGQTPVLRAGKAVANFAPLVDSAASRRIPEHARRHVLQVDLGSAGISDFGCLRPRGRGPGKLASMDEPAHLELFVDGVPMPLARWPNDTPKMSERFAKVSLGDQEKTRDGGRTITPNSDTFFYADQRQDAWADEPDAWLFGYWQRAYFSSYRKALHIDPAKDSIQVDWNCAPGTRTLPEMVEGSGYQGINLLCELDSPGEWYLDRQTGILYFWPPHALSRSSVLVSLLEQPVIRAENAADIIVRGLTLEAGRQHGVEIRDGSGILLAGCVIRSMGCKGVTVSGGRDHTIIGCDLEYLGDAGAKVVGGDLPSLQSCGHVVENCHIHHFAHWNRGAYQPGIEVEGVGVRMSHCLIHDAPHQAFLLSGNDHITEYCEVHDVTHEAGDAGAWYMYGGGGAALSERGNVVRYNYWHDLPYNETFKKYHCVTHMGVYIDNVNGGVTVYGNVFSRFDGPSGAVFFGGSDDIVENNVFYRCHTGINLEDRSWVYGKAYKSIDAFLAAMKVTEPPWSVRYPRLTTIAPGTEDLTLIVRGNVAARNVGIECPRFIFGNATTMRYARIEQNWEKGTPGFRNPGDGDFRLKPHAPVVGRCFFEPLPWEKIGLYKDPLRASWPVRHPSGNYETLYVDTTKLTRDERKPREKMPVCRAQPRAAVIRIDGKLEPDEWDGLRPDDGFLLNRNPEDLPTQARPSIMWLRRDDQTLYIAIRNELEPGQTAKPKDASASWWGGADIAEIIFEGTGGDWWPADTGHGPIFYLVGDCTGAFESYAIAGLPKTRAAGLSGAVQYAAAAEPGSWSAEWRIPIAALGLEPGTSPGCCFNVGVHKPRSGSNSLSPNDQWAVWVGARGANWKVWNAGWLSLEN